MVGDSLTVLGDQPIRAALTGSDWWAALDAFPGRTTGTQMDAIRAAAHRDNDATVIELGTNDALAIARGELSIVEADGTATTIILGPDLVAGQRPQGTVPPNAWQAARPLGSAVLVGCTVAPAFEFEHFELAPAGWEPPR